tara:strand:- start:2486 stop:2839 length:354 start_codon:yes stop_codon:yes gene_type:complete
MVRRHVATPEVPDQLLDWQAILFSAIKENVELLTGTRGESDLASMAITRGDVSANQLGQQDMGNVTQSGDDGYVISGQDVASLDALRNLRADVQVLANDLFRTRQTLDLLIRNLTGA